MTQNQALDILKTGGNVFLTGEPGAGKTYVLNQFLGWLEMAGLHVAVTASTGIAATHIGGMTIHSWSSIGARDQLSAYDLDQITTKEKTVKRIKQAQVLVIDEISMLSAGTLDSVEKVCRTIRQSPDAFGGLQVVFVGDFFQLPPITPQGDMVQYAFEGNAWRRAQPLVCYLTEQYRQEDELFLGLLRAIRKNDINDDHFTLLQEQTEIAYPEIEPTRLHTHNADVDAINYQKLSELKGKRASYKMSASGNKQLLQGLVKSCLSPEKLELCEEAMVMCTKNNFEAGYVNGTLGRVVDFDTTEGFPIIETSEGKRIKIKPTSWDIVEDNKVLASIEQIPLRLAWAITVHKSQGMSLDAAEMDLSRAFVYGQGYVALSRVRSLDGLKLTGIHPNALEVDPRVLAQNERFQAASAAAERTFEDMDVEELVEMHQAFVGAMDGVLPDPDAVLPDRETLPEKVKKESTYEQTLELLRAGKAPAQIAKERKMIETTIWSHLEKLAEDEMMTLEDVRSLYENNTDLQKAYTVLVPIMEEEGSEKLRPIYDAANEEYDYLTIRSARLLYQLGYAPD